MQIIIEIPDDTILHLMTSAIEGGDPVTTASKGGWCAGIFWHSRNATPPNGPWYSNPTTWSAEFQVEIVEIVEEATGREKTHKVRRADALRGLTVMAKKFPENFAEVMADKIDAMCADAFLQAMLFGEEKYA